MTSNKVGKAEVINIGSGKECSVNDVAKLIGGKTTNIPDRIEPKKVLLDTSKASKLLGWKSAIILKDWVKEYKKEIGLNEKSKRTRKKSK